ncbi:hypothetical protein GCM10011517_01930 [Actibacterium pelagium]|uniref:Uncharacterized protein n=1 Tax=Actibacterium pelagium TaxID=2029103 RepID=A0A917AAQ4_9RHOB|nr:hypothetical protein GCM10011517_01930 [Actibacterium pelagium]
MARLGCTVVPGLSGAAVVGKTTGNDQRSLVGIVSANLFGPTGMKAGIALAVGIGRGLEALRALQQ